MTSMTFYCRIFMEKLGKFCFWLAHHCWKVCISYLTWNNNKTWTFGYFPTLIHICACPRTTVQLAYTDIDGWYAYTSFEYTMRQWFLAANNDRVVSQTEYPSLVDLRSLLLDHVARLLGALSRIRFSYLEKDLAFSLWFLFDCSTF